MLEEKSSPSDSPPVWTNSNLRSPVVTAPLWPSARTGAATSAVTTGVAAGAADLGVSFTKKQQMQ